MVLTRIFFRLFSLFFGSYTFCLSGSLTSTGTSCRLGRSFGAAGGRDFIVRFVVGWVVLRQCSKKCELGLIKR